MKKQLKHNCYTKRGYITGPLFNKKQQLLKDKSLSHITWYSPKGALTNSSAHDAYWNDTKQLLHSNYFIADLNTNDIGVAYELGVVWTVNYLRNILNKNDFKEATKLLDKFQFPAKKIIGITNKNNKCNHKYLMGSVADQGKIVSSLEKAIASIKKPTK